MSNLSNDGLLMKRMKTKRISFFRIILASVICFCFSAIPLGAQQFSRYTSEINTPTAYTLAQGTYQFGLMAYDSGGTDFRTFVGLTDQFFLGVSFDIEHAVGSEKINMNVPGVIAKFKITDGTESFPISFSLGYDAFYMGATHRVTKYDEYEEPYTVREPYNNIIYGPFFVVTKPIYILDDEQHINFGLRVPVQPVYNPADTSWFLSLDVPLGQYFVIKAETERIYYNLSRNEEWMYNAGFRYNIFTKVGLEIDVMMQKEKMPTRVVKIEYTDTF